MMASSGIRRIPKRSAPVGGCPVTCHEQLARGTLVALEVGLLASNSEELTNGLQGLIPVSYQLAVRQPKECSAPPRFTL
jgi:hypothetical protein